MAKRKNTYTKHDLRRKIESIEMGLFNILERVATVERVFNDYLEMHKDEDKFKEFLNGKYKQPEHKQSGRDTSPSV